MNGLDIAEVRRTGCRMHTDTARQQRQELLAHWSDASGKQGERELLEEVLALQLAVLDFWIAFWEGLGGSS